MSFKRLALIVGGAIAAVAVWRDDPPVRTGAFAPPPPVPPRWRR